MFNSRHNSNTWVVVVRAELEAFIQVTAVKTLQFAKHSVHWIESVFWIVLLIGATGLATRDIRKAYQEFKSEATHTSMQVVGLQKMTFESAILCVDYDALTLNLSDSQLFRQANRVNPNDLAKSINSSTIVFLNRVLKLVTAFSLIEHGRSADFEKKLAKLEPHADLEKLHNWLHTEGVDIFGLSRLVGDWLCNSAQVKIVTIHRGKRISTVNPCNPARISWLGVIVFASSPETETAVCVDIGGLITFENMFDSVIINVNQTGSAAYLDFSGDPVSTDMTNDYITFPDGVDNNCFSFALGVSNYHLVDRYMSRCNASAKTRLRCYAYCDIHDRYANTKLWNCTQFAWRQLYSSNLTTMCIDALTIQDHLDSRHLSPTINFSGPCWTACLYPCEFRQYDKILAPGGCERDFPSVMADGVSVELNADRFRVPTFEEQFSVGVTDLFSRLGGTCGLWLGVGLLGVCHALLFPFKLLAKLLMQHHRSQHHRSKPTLVYSTPSVAELKYFQ